MASMDTMIEPDGGEEATPVSKLIGDAITDFALHSPKNPKPRRYAEREASHSTQQEEDAALLSPGRTGSSSEDRSTGSGRGRSRGKSPFAKAAMDLVRKSRATSKSSTPPASLKTKSGWGQIFQDLSYLKSISSPPQSPKRTTRSKKERLRAQSNWEQLRGKFWPKFRSRIQMGEFCMLGMAGRNLTYDQNKMLVALEEELAKHAKEESGQAYSRQATSKAFSKMKVFFIKVKINKKATSAMLDIHRNYQQMYMNQWLYLVKSCEIVKHEMWYRDIIQGAMAIKINRNMRTFWTDSWPAMEISESNARKVILDEVDRFFNFIFAQVDEDNDRRRLVQTEAKDYKVLRDEQRRDQLKVFEDHQQRTRGELMHNSDSRWKFLRKLLMLQTKETTRREEIWQQQLVAVVKIRKRKPRISASQNQADPTQGVTDVSTLAAVEQLERMDVEQHAASMIDVIEQVLLPEDISRGKVEQQEIEDSDVLLQVKFDFDRESLQLLLDSIMRWEFSERGLIEKEYVEECDLHQACLHMAHCEDDARNMISEECNTELHYLVESVGLGSREIAFRKRIVKEWAGGLKIIRSILKCLNQQVVSRIAIEIDQDLQFSEFNFSWGIIQAEDDERANMMSYAKHHRKVMVENEKARMIREQEDELDEFVDLEADWRGDIVAEMNREQEATIIPFIGTIRLTFEEARARIREEKSVDVDRETISRMRVIFGEEIQQRKVITHSAFMVPNFHMIIHIETLTQEMQTKRKEITNCQIFGRKEMKTRMTVYRTWVKPWAETIAHHRIVAFEFFVGALMKKQMKARKSIVAMHAHATIFVEGVSDIMRDYYKGRLKLWNQEIFTYERMLRKSSFLLYSFEQRGQIRDVENRHWIDLRETELENWYQAKNFEISNRERKARSQISFQWQKQWSVNFEWLAHISVDELQMRDWLKYERQKHFVAFGIEKQELKERMVLWAEINAEMESVSQHFQERLQRWITVEKFVQDLTNQMLVEISQRGQTECLESEPLYRVARATGFLSSLEILYAHMGLEQAEAVARQIIKEQQVPEIETTTYIWWSIEAEQTVDRQDILVEEAEDRCSILRHAWVDKRIKKVEETQRETKELVIQGTEARELERQRQKKKRDKLRVEAEKRDKARRDTKQSKIVRPEKSVRSGSRDKEWELLNPENTSSRNSSPKSKESFNALPQVRKSVNSAVQSEDHKYKGLTNGQLPLLPRANSAESNDVKLLFPGDGQKRSSLPEPLHSTRSLTPPHLTTPPPKIKSGTIPKDRKSKCGSSSSAAKYALPDSALTPPANTLSSHSPRSAASAPQPDIGSPAQTLDHSSLFPKPKGSSPKNGWVAPESISSEKPAAPANDVADAQIIADVIEGYNSRAIRLCGQGNYDQARGYLNKALDMLRADEAVLSPEVRVSLHCSTLNNFGCMEKARGNAAEAADILRAAMSMEAAAYGSPSPSLMVNLCCALTSIGSADEAITKGRTAIGILTEDLRRCQTSPAEVHQKQQLLVYAWQTLGTAQAISAYKVERMQAEESMAYAVELATSFLGRDHPSTHSIQQAFEEFLTQQTALR